MSPRKLNTFLRSRYTERYSYPNKIDNMRNIREQNMVLALIKVPFALVNSNKVKAIPVTGRGGLQGCEILRIPHCLDNMVIDGGKVVSSTHQPHLFPGNIIF
jgi:hypothetical protein